MPRIDDRVEAVRARQQKQWMWQNVSLGLVVGGCLGCLLATARLLVSDAISGAAIAAVVLACPLAACIYALVRPRRARDAAVAIDRQYAFKDRVATALHFMQQASPSPLQQLQVDDAASQVDRIDPRRVAPLRAPRSWGWGLALCAAAVVIALVSRPREQVQAAVTHNEVVIRQADRVAEDIEELEKFNKQAVDPELEQLLKELAQKLEAMKQPGVDPKEALAKLSEMEAALQARQQQLADPAADAALQQVGEALSLADAFQAAGQALARGDMEKAAEELEKLELPELDRQTERAIAEKLDKVQQNASQGSPRTLQQAAGQVSSGITQGDRSQFKDGMKGLAGECKKQGNRKKLADLLRKQCNSLAECKSECEGACKSTGESKKKGGTQWGLAKSGNEPAEKTAKLKTGPQMQLKGIESESGDADAETIQAPEQQQAAAREYREKIDKYEQLSESVLESEPIPLGHRQTIRRYFELIRPQDEQTDAIVREAAPQP